MQKLLYVTPHLSTGGLPQYLLKKIEHFKSQFDIYVIEYQDLSWEYVVQKNKIKQLLGEDKLITLTKDKQIILDHIKNINPNIIHFEEIPEHFIDPLILQKIFSLSQYSIISTTHSSNTNPSTLTSTPDKFILVSEWSKNKFESVVNVPCDIWEYPIEDLTPNKEKYQKELKFDPNYKHIINVGLFTPGKNQSEVFKVAKQLVDKNIIFHFIGNQASNFEDYWGPLIKNKPKNCKVWGERNDVEKFLQAADLFYFSSILELNPLVVKESLSYKLPVIMRKLHTYENTYDNNNLITFIDNNLEKTKSIILEKLKL
jgi:glycosyltransferase involved in cell wall biosynthesis